MPKLKHAYVNTPHRRVLTAADFKNIGVEDQVKVEFTPENRHVAEVSEAAAKWLIENEPGDWQLVDDDDDESSRSSESAEGNAENSESPDASNSTRRRTRS